MNFINSHRCTINYFMGARVVDGVCACVRACVCVTGDNSERCLDGVVEGHLGISPKTTYKGVW